MFLLSVRANYSTETKNQPKKKLNCRALNHSGSIKGHIKGCGSPPGVMMADTLSFNAKIGVVDF